MRVYGLFPRVLVLFAFWGVFAGVASAAPPEPQWRLEPASVEDRLSTAVVVAVEEIGEGVTNPKKVTLDLNGERFFAVYKPIRRGRHKGFWESYQAEVAAYRLDTILGLDMVPPTIVRRVEADKGSLQLWVAGCETYKRVQAKVPRTPGFSRQISRMKMFDNLIYNEDRNAGNFLLDEDWNLVLIDHSRAFLDRKKLLEKSSQLPVQYDRRLVERLRVLRHDELERGLEGLLMKGQIESILERRDLLLRHLDELIAERGEAQVLF